MNINLLKELRENRPFLLVLLGGLFLIIFLWIAIRLIFRPEPEELVVPFPTSTTGTTGAVIPVSGNQQATFTPAATRTGSVTPIVLSTFTPRTAEPFVTATDRALSLLTPTLTPRPTNTPRTPTLTLRPTNTPRPPTVTPRPTNTPRPPTLTLRPTNTPRPPTVTPRPTNTPRPPTVTPRPTNTRRPPTQTPRPTGTRPPPPSATEEVEPTAPTTYP